MCKTRLISDREVRQVLTIQDLIPMMRDAFADTSAGRLNMLPRSSLFHQNGNIFALMSASLPRFGMCGCKTAIFPGPAAAAAGTSQSVIVLFDIETGALRGIVSAEYITLVRTAASTAAATDALAMPGADTLCLLGAGAQAMAHAEAICAVRPIREIRVWDIAGDRAQAAADTLARQHGVRAHAAATAEDAVTGAHIVCTVTKAREPILQGEWLSAGTHVNAVGACGPIFRELDPTVMDRARVYVDSMDTAMTMAGDLLIPMKEGRFSKGQIAGEIGQVLEGVCPGRAPDDRETITLFETCGLACQDVTAACAALNKVEGGQTFQF